MQKALMPSPMKTIEIEVAELCDLMADFEADHSLDLGSTVLHVGKHVHLGRVLFVSTACGRAAYLQM